MLVAAIIFLFIFLKNAYPINVLNRLKNISKIVNFYCATANLIEVIIAEIKQGRETLGVIDSGSPTGVENEKDKKKRAFKKNWLQALKN